MNVCIGVNDNCSVISRWLEYFFLGPVVFVHFALTSGTREVLTLILITFCIGAIMPFGFLFEVQSSTTSSYLQSTHIGMHCSCSSNN